MERLLLIDDEMSTCRLFVSYLEPAGFAVDVVHDGEEGLESLCTRPYDLILMDVVLPRINGFEVLRRLRKDLSIPVIMVTNRDDEIDIVVGLEMGADDYMIKPVKPRELLARIRAVLRRSQRQLQGTNDVTASQRLAVGDVEMELGSRLVFCGGKQINLTTVEFLILEALLKNAGQTVLRNDLKRAVLGRQPDPYDRSLDVHVSRLRKKLGCHLLSGTTRIQAIRGAGYLYSVPPASLDVFSLHPAGPQANEMIG